MKVFILCVLLFQSVFAVSPQYFTCYYNKASNSFYVKNGINLFRVLIVQLRILVELLGPLFMMNLVLLAGDDCTYPQIQSFTIINNRIVPVTQPKIPTQHRICRGSINSCSDRQLVFIFPFESIQQPINGTSSKTPINLFK